jgi:hypothetical protein
MISVIKTPEFEDFVRIFTPEGEIAVPLREVRAILRKSPTSALTQGLELSRHFPPPPAVGVELKDGEIVWSDGETDWYYSGHPSRIGK